MRALNDSFDDAVVAEIDARLTRVQTEFGVAIPWAIESGSRAWGFPSPDSDYDCRFFYVRSAAAHVSPWSVRDVIETPLDKIFDVNGWDLAKAVRLATGGNATVGEWLRSPLVYAGDQAFRDGLLAVIEELIDPARIRRHYAHVGMRSWEGSGARSGEVRSLKKVFYALRPAAVLHWMDEHGSATPPMNLIELLDQAPPPVDVRAAIDTMLEAKAVTRELGPGAVPANIHAWVEQELTTELERDRPLALPRGTERTIEAYRELVERFGPQ